MHARVAPVAAAAGEEILDQQQQSATSKASRKTNEMKTWRILLQHVLSSDKLALVREPLSWIYFKGALRRSSKRHMLCALNNRLIDAKSEFEAAKKINTPTRKISISFGAREFSVKSVPILFMRHPRPQFGGAVSYASRSLRPVLTD